MVKKFKVQDLEAEPDSSTQDNDYTKISLDALTDEEPLALSPAPPMEAPAPEKQISKPQRTARSTPVIDEEVKTVTRVEIVKELVSFERHYVWGYLFKIFNYLVVYGVLELTFHLMKFFDDKNVLDPSTFRSMIFGNNTNSNLLVVVVFLVGVFILTPNEKLNVTRRGIFCSQVRIINLFYTTSNVFITWDQIGKVKYSVRLFEPFLLFYDTKGEQIGQVDFNLKNKKEFFQHIEKYAGKDHPLSKVRTELQ